MKSTRKLRLRLRLIEATLVLLLGILTTGAVATRQLLLDASNRPTSDISLASDHWTDTLDPARLPDSVPLIADGTLGVTLFRADSIRGQSGADGPDFVDGFQMRGETSEQFFSNLTRDELVREDHAVFGDVSSDTLIVADSMYIDQSGSLSTPGSLSAGYLFIADAAVADSQGYVYTGNQPYLTGTVTPTGRLTFKDSTGNVYYVPAVAAPLP